MVDKTVDEVVATHKYGWRVQEVAPIAVFLLIAGGVWFTGNLLGSIVVCAVMVALAGYMFLVNVNRKSKSEVTGRVKGGVLSVDGFKYESKSNKIVVSQLGYITVDKDAWHPTLKFVGRKKGRCLVPKRLALEEPLNEWLRESISKGVRVEPVAKDLVVEVFGWKPGEMNVGKKQVDLRASLGEDKKSGVGEPTLADRFVERTKKSD